MFCPKCSQQQVNDETRFCSRCGFELNVVKALLSSGSNLPSAETRKPDRSLRKRDMTIGAFLMFVLAFFGAAVTSDLPPNHTGRIIIFVLAWIGLTVLINIKPMIQYFLRGDHSALPVEEISTAKVFSKINWRQKNALPESRSIPAVDFVKPTANTAEMVQPFSLTEETTNLLNK